MLKTITGAISAGLLITIGGTVFLACDNKYVGSLLFSVALLCICYLGYYLYTGKIGYLTKDYSLKNISYLFIGLIINLLITFLLGLLIHSVFPNLGNTANIICNKKLEQSFIITLVRATFCGVLMYLAVEIFIKFKTPLGIIFCIPVFILSGFEHSIADMFYFGASGILDSKIILFELAAILGNTIGSLILPLLTKVGEISAKNKC